MNSDPIYLYAIRESTTGNIKLGMSRDPVERRRQHSSGNSGPLTLLGWREASEPVEHDAHMLLNPWARPGVHEWFDPAGPVLLLAWLLDADWRGPFAWTERTAYAADAWAAGAHRLAAWLAAPTLAGIEARGDAMLSRVEQLQQEGAKAYGAAGRAMANQQDDCRAWCAALGSEPRTPDDQRVYEELEAEIETWRDHG